MQSVQGSDLFSPGRHVGTTSLTASSGWRREIDTRISSPPDEDFVIGVRFGMFDTTQPLLSGLGTRHGVGSFLRWSQNNVVDVGGDVHLIGDRIRYSGEVSWSRFRTLAGTQPLPRESGIWLAPDWRGGFAWWQGVEVKLLYTSGGKASLFAIHGNMDAAYRSLESTSDSPLIFDGRTVKFGGNAELGRWNLSFVDEQVASPYIKQHQVSAKLRHGRLDLKFTARTVTYPGAGGTWDQPLRDSRWKAMASIAIAQARPRAWLPDKLEFEVSYSEKGNPTAGFGPTTWQRFGLGFAWTSARSSTQVFLRQARVRSGNPLDDGRTTGEFSLDASHWVAGKGWDLTLYTTLSNSRLGDSWDRSFGGGAALSITDKRWPPISLGVDYNRTGLGLDAYNYTYRDSELSLSGSIDLSRYLPAVAGGRKPFLIAKANADWGRTRENLLAPEATLDVTAFVTLGMNF